MAFQKRRSLHILMSNAAEAVNKNENEVRRVTDAIWNQFVPDASAKSFANVRKQSKLSVALWFHILKMILWFILHFCRRQIRAAKL